MNNSPRPPPPTIGQDWCREEIFRPVALAWGLPSGAALRVRTGAALAVLICGSIAVQDRRHPARQGRAVFLVYRAGNGFMASRRLALSAQCPDLGMMDLDEKAVPKAAA